MINKSYHSLGLSRIATVDGEKEKRIQENIKRGLSLFNSGAFFEAHEALESAWKMDDTQRKALIQGLIQFSVGCHHATRKNWKGAEKVLLRARSKLIPYIGCLSFVDLDSVISQVDELIAQVTRVRNLNSENVELDVTPKIHYIENQPLFPNQDDPGRRSI